MSDQPIRSVSDTALWVAYYRAMENVQGRRQLFARVNSSASTAMVITEGLLAYLRPEDVAILAQNLHDQPKFRYWISDLASPAILERTQKHWGKQLSAANAPM